MNELVVAKFYIHQLMNEFGSGAISDQGTVVDMGVMRYEKVKFYTLFIEQISVSEFARVPYVDGPYKWYLVDQHPHSSRLAGWMKLNIEPEGYFGKKSTYVLVDSLDRAEMVVIRSGAALTQFYIFPENMTKLNTPSQKIRTNFKCLTERLSCSPTRANTLNRILCEPDIFKQCGSR